MAKRIADENFSFSCLNKKMSQSSREILGGLGPDQRIRFVLPFLVAITFFECIAQYTLKKGKQDGGSKWSCLLIAAICYAIVCYLLYRSYEYEGIGHMNLLWSMGSIILAYAVGVTLFDEHLNKYGYLAIFLACLTIYVSRLNDENPREAVY